MVKFFAEQDGVAQHLFPLERSFPRGQSQMAVKDVEDRTGLYFEIHAQAESRLPVTLVTQIVLLVMHDGKGTHHRDSKRALSGRPRGAERRLQSQIAGD